MRNVILDTSKTRVDGRSHTRDFYPGILKTFGKKKVDIIEDIIEPYIDGTTANNLTQKYIYFILFNI